MRDKQLVKSRSIDVLTHAVAMALKEQGVQVKIYERQPLPSMIVMRVPATTPRFSRVYTAIVVGNELLFGLTEGSVLNSFDLNDPEALEKIAAFSRLKNKMLCLAGSEMLLCLRHDYVANIADDERFGE